MNPTYNVTGSVSVLSTAFFMIALTPLVVPTTVIELLYAAISRSFTTGAIVATLIYGT
jgi:hypothetical protein